MEVKVEKAGTQTAEYNLNVLEGEKVKENYRIAIIHSDSRIHRITVSKPGYPELTESISVSNLRAIQLFLEKHKEFEVKAWWEK